MLATPSSRRLLVIDPYKECHQIMPELHAMGWEMEFATLATTSERSCDVGLIRLEPLQLMRPEAVKEMIRLSGIEWIAVLSPDDLAIGNVGNFVCEWFYDFHTLPFDVQRLAVTLGRTSGMVHLRNLSAPPVNIPDHQLLGESHPMQDLRMLLSKYASAESPVLIQGETGTGKKRVALTLHHQSRRHEQPFVAINCAVVPQHLLETQLFGHDAGPFSGVERKIGLIEAADGGTLFLDEIDELTPELQASVRRFLLEKQIRRVGGSQPIPIDVRVLAATSVDLEAEINSARFRADLYYRLNVLQVTVPPLRDRHGDLDILANHFSRFYSLEVGRRPRTFSKDALMAMGIHDWPGNVRELANRVRQGLAQAQGRQIEAGDLGLACTKQSTDSIGTLADYKDRAERQALCDVLHRYSRNLSMAAKVLGVSRPTFYRLLHKHQIR